MSRENFTLPHPPGALSPVKMQTVWTSSTANVHNSFSQCCPPPMLVTIAPAVWQFSPVHTDGHFGCIIALEMILVCRLDGKPTPGTRGCQLQPGTLVKVTTLLPYGQAGCTEHSCSAHTCHTSGQKWPGHRLLSWDTQGARGEAWGVSSVTNLLTLLLGGQVKVIHLTFESFKVPANQYK